MYIQYIMKPVLSPAHTEAAVRTQIYLSASQQRRLDQLARRSAQSKSSLIRAAIDRMLEAEEQAAAGTRARKQRLLGLAGAWANKPADELLDVRALRDGWSQRSAI
ncbi:CopG family transcriptional regulator [Ottowia testudinis]|uniref:Ribbon-helix-helix protein, CopG family n=1 Tax=Ottowia testudinis TaxID=2816950 RepID=A0A975CI18_9BURK|nr:CopG family transcriptional regulator [Ottowia testudinis]QTD45322.1 ribbon-helix-helix protein, CopG family [Ottowia testudinis]